MRNRLKNYFIPHKGNDYKPNSIRSQSLIITLIMGFGIMGMALFGSQTIPAISQLANVQSTFLAQVTNEKRTQNKVSELSINEQLKSAAQLKAQDMIENNYFAHISPEGKQPWYWMDQAGYQYKYAGENLAIDFYDTKEVAEAWMNSPTHRRNILNNNYTEIGIAVDVGRYNGRKVAFVVQMFGSPRFENIPININPASQQISSLASETNTNNNREGYIVLALEDIVNSQEVLGDTTVFVNESDMISDIQMDTILPEETFTETIYDGENDSQSGQNFIHDGSEENTLHSDVLKAFARPVVLGQILLVILTSLIAISLILKIVIEIKRQHYKNVIFGILIMIALVLIYIILEQRIHQVVII